MFCLNKLYIVFIQLDESCFLFKSNPHNRTSIVTVCTERIRCQVCHFIKLLLSLFRFKNRFTEFHSLLVLLVRQGLFDRVYIV